MDGLPAVAVVENDTIGVLSSAQADNKTIAIPPGKNVDVVVVGTLAYVGAEQAGAQVSRARSASTRWRARLN